MVECHTCWQNTLVIGDGDPHCPFCGFTRTAEELANTLDEGPLDDEECIECGAETLSFILYSNEDGAAYCTSCGTTQRICLTCGSLFIGGGDYCPACNVIGLNPLD